MLASGIHIRIHTYSLIDVELSPKQCVYEFFFYLSLGQWQNGTVVRHSVTGPSFVHPLYPCELYQSHPQLDFGLSL